MAGIVIRFSAAIPLRPEPFGRLACERLVAAAELLAVAVGLLEVETDHLVAAIDVRVEPAGEPFV